MVAPSIIAPIVIVIDIVLVLKSESETVAVIVCVPTERVDMENELPTPIEPSISEVQDIKFERPPSSGSVAEAENVREEPSIETKLSTGSEIDNVGDPITLMVIVIDCETVLPSESETVAVITWIPTGTVELEIKPPVPITP